jgi:SWI/SNF-related matrix-associated actin-dependent regulator of chromatin subfamily A-like protein 1
MNDLILSPYQETGVQFLSERRFALLGDDMGLGKSAQAIVAAVKINAKRILVICPAVARVNWQREFLQWSGLNFKVCTKLGDHPIGNCIVSYDYATANAEIIAKFNWDLIICDESHFIKEPTAKRTQRIYGKEGIIRKAARLWCLSGTPAPNHVGELWPMLYTFGATRLTYEEFTHTFCDSRPTFYAGKRQERITGTKSAAIPEIKKTLERIMLRRLKKDVLADLPAISFQIVTVEGSPLPEVIRLDPRNVNRDKEIVYAAMEAAMDSELDMVLERIQNSVSTLRRYIGLQKVKAVAEIVTDELENKAYEKVVIFAIHIDVIAQIQISLEQFNPVVVNGKTTDRQAAVDTFQNDKACRVFIGNITAAGTAITLTAAHQVIFVEQSWTPGDNRQAADRCHRRGQSLPVSVRFISLADSLDEKIAAVLKRKTEQLTQIFDAKSETHLTGE